jgi:hypothetical protein
MRPQRIVMLGINNDSYNVVVMIALQFSGPLNDWLLNRKHQTVFSDTFDFLVIEICVEGGSSSRAVTRIHTMIGLTGYRTRDLLRIRRALYRRTKKA